jgi:hypothetical protein
MTSAWNTYLGTLRELHQARAAAADRTEHTEEAARTRAAQVDALAGQVRDQERRISALAAEIRKPVSFRGQDPSAVPGAPGSGLAGPAGHVVWDEAVADLTGHLHGAEVAAGDLEYFAARPTLLPNWPDWARNGAIYFAYSLPNVLINWGLYAWLFTVDDTGTRAVTAALWGCCFWPIAAVVAGIATIRVVGVPRLVALAAGKGRRDQPKAPTVALHLPLGIAIALGTSAGSVMLPWLLGAAINF